MSAIGQDVRIFKTKQWGMYPYWMACFIFCVLPILLIAVLPIHDLFLPGHVSDLALAGLLIFISIGVAVFSFRFAPRAAGRRIEIDSEEIREIGFYRTKSMPLAEVRGFEVVGNQQATCIRLCTKTPSYGKIRIDQQYERYAELVDWIKAGFTDLDAARYDEELKEISSNERLGSTPEARAAKYRLVRLVCYAANGIGTFVLMWAMIHPRPYHALIWTLIVLPFVAFLILRWFAGAVKLDGSTKSAYANVAVLWLGSPFALCLQAMKMNLFDFERFWEPFALITAGFGALTVWLAPETRRPLWKLILYATFWSMFGGGVTLTLNAAYVTSKPIVSHVEVRAKRVNHDRGASYFLTLSPWYTLQKEKELAVSWPVYQKYSVGDLATVQTRIGFFGIPYAFVE